MYNSTNMCVASRHAAQPLVNLMLGDYFANNGFTNFNWVMVKHISSGVVSDRKG